MNSVPPEPLKTSFKRANLTLQSLSSDKPIPIIRLPSKELMADLKPYGQFQGRLTRGEKILRPYSKSMTEEETKVVASANDDMLKLCYFFRCKPW